MKTIRSLAVFFFLFQFSERVLCQESNLQSFKFTLSAAEAFERGTEGAAIQRNSTGDGLVLYDVNLVEDDGPGVGTDADFMEERHRSPTLLVTGDVRVKKILHIPDPAALTARLYVPEGLHVEVNGAVLAGPEKGRYRDLPVSLLKKGDNEIVLAAPAGVRATLKTARRKDILANSTDRSDRPPRTWISTDRGNNWRAIDGEAMVRILLSQHTTEGHLVSPVIDAAQMEHKSTPLSGPVSITSIALTHDADSPAGTGIEWMARTGSSPVYDRKNWSDWQPVSAPVTANQRFLQWKAVLKSSNAKTTPTLRNVTVEGWVATSVAPAWASRIRQLEVRNPEIRHTFIPFEYENPSHPRLIALRRKYKLDEVVSGASTELEKFVKLRDWVSKQWKFSPPVSGGYPAWDADEILTRKTGFCVQYAIVYMQCALSLGYQARFVFGDHPGTIEAGHEVCEVWSNQYGKWIYMDPNDNEHYVDPSTGVPLSMLETHQRLLRTYYPNKIATFANRPTAPAHSPYIGICKGLSMTPSPTLEVAGEPAKRWDSWTKWLHVRYMPRNNFLSQPVPVPRSQGLNWDWTDYYVVHGEQLSRQGCYRNFTARKSDVESTLNLTRFAVEWGPEAGTMRIQLGTFTPWFENFQIRKDGQEWSSVSSEFSWNLHPGVNRLEMRTQSALGIAGQISSLQLDFKHE